MLIRLFSFLIVSLFCQFASALEITFQKSTPRGCELHQPAIVLSGNIVNGDAGKLAAWLKNNNDVFLNVRPSFVLDSPGGSISEAVLLAQLLESIAATVWLPPACVNVSVAKIPRCASACFALVVGASSRIIGESQVGLHRPYFERASYANLNAQEAQAIYNEAIKEFSHWLREKQVAQSLIEKMNNVSSKEVYWLNLDEVNSLGEISPWLEEYLIARCDFDKALLVKSFRATNPGEAIKLRSDYSRQGECVRRIIVERRQAWLNSK